MLNELLPPLTEADILRFKELGEKLHLSSKEQEEFEILDQKMRESVLTSQERQTYKKIQSLVLPAEPAAKKRSVRAWPYVLLGFFISIGAQGMISAAGLDSNLATLLSGMACIIVPSALWIYNKREKDNEFYPWYLPLIQLALVYMFLISAIFLASSLFPKSIGTLSLFLPIIVAPLAVWLPIYIYKKIRKNNA